MSVITGPWATAPPRQPPPERVLPGLRRVKLTPPRNPAGSIRRPELEAELERTADLPLTLVLGRAGFGKTSLLASWARTTERAVAWLSLDETDADLRRFSSQFVAAIRMTRPGVATGIDAALASAANPEPALVGRLLADGLLDLDEPVVVVIDDLQAVGAGPAAALSAFLEFPPEAVRLVIGSRSCPEQLDVRRLRALGLTAEIGEERLRFGLDEVQRLLGARDASRAGAVMARTDGWAAGVRAVAIGGPATASKPPDSVTAYLEHDVLEGQPPELVALLRQVATVERVSPGLASALSGGRIDPDQAAALLDDAERRGLFVSRLGSGNWWRLHPLLRDVLLAGPAGSMPGDASAADHECAIRWLVEAGEPMEAVGLAVRVGLLESAANIMAGHIVDWLSANRWADLEIVEHLPPALVERTPELMIARAALLVMRGRGPEAGAMLQAAEPMLAARGVADDPNALTLRWEIVHLGGAAENHGATALVSTEDFRLLMDRPAGASGSAALVAGPMWGLRMMEEGRWSDAEPAVSARAAETVRAGGAGAAWTAWAMAGLHLRNADAAAAATWLAFIDPSSSDGDRPVPMWFRNTQSELLLETGDLAGAERAALSGLALQDPRLNVRRDLAARLARILAVTGRHAEAASFIEEERRRLLLAGATHLLPEIDATAAELALAGGDAIGARRWADSTEPAFSHDPVRTLDHPVMAQARIWLDRDAPHDAAMAVRTLSALRAHCEALHDRFGLARLLPLLAVAHALAGDPVLALATMREALEIEPGRLTRRFAEAGPEALPLLRLIASEPAPSAASWFAGRLLAAAANPSAAAPGAPDDAPASPLTTRQTEIVRLMARWLTDKEIAEALGLSSRTVSKHIEHILRRLDATDRRAAVAIAQAAGWIDHAGSGPPLAIVPPPVARAGMGAGR